VLFITPHTLSQVPRVNWCSSYADPRPPHPASPSPGIHDCALQTLWRLRIEFKLFSTCEEMYCMECLSKFAPCCFKEKCYPGYVHIYLTCHRFPMALLRQMDQRRGHPIPLCCALLGMDSASPCTINKEYWHACSIPQILGFCRRPPKICRSVSSGSVSGRNATRRAPTLLA
jgi:hypothetical protein